MNEPPSLESLLAYQRYIQTGPFMTGVVHDINNAIGAVISYSELIGMGSHPQEELDAMLDELRTAARRTADLNDALSTLTRRETPKRAPVSISSLVAQVAMVCEYRFRTEHVALDVSLEGDMARPVICYKNELARAMLYLLINALENAAPGPRKEVSFVACLDTIELRIGIRDHGPALGVGAFGRAIEPFATSKGPPHLGLGLTAVQAIADLHGGRLSYDPETGVTLAIPVQAD